MCAAATSSSEANRQALEIAEQHCTALDGFLQASLLQSHVSLLYPAGMALSLHDWQSAIQLLDQLAAAPACSSGGTADAAHARALALEAGMLLKRLDEGFDGFKQAPPMTQAAWNKLVLKKQVC
jgi:hypothetical protein